MVTRRGVGALLGGLLPLRRSAAQDYPTRPIRLVVSYPPGGPADLLARDMAHRLGAALPGQMLVDNRPGANGNIGAAAAARALSDGYTLFMLTSSHCANMTLYREPGYDIGRDFTPISNIVSYPLLLVAHPSQNLHSVQEVLARAKAEPDRLTFASAGSGGGAHLAAELFLSAASIRMTHIPYNGTGPALLGVVTGAVTMMFAGVSAALPHVQSGRLVALGISGRRRLAGLPDLPTIAESGLPGYEVTSWLGLVAPTGTPGATITRLHGALGAVVAEPGFQAQLAGDGALVEVSSPVAFGNYMQAEVAKWARVIRASGARID